MKPQSSRAARKKTDYRKLFLARGDLGYGQIGKVWAKSIVAAPVALPHEPGVRPPFQLTGRFGGRDFF
jgi:hypothetical protein